METIKNDYELRIANDGLQNSRNLKSGERGAALVALLAALTIIAIVLLAAAPNVYQQALRDRELESMARGEEVADAILIFMNYNNGQPPKTMQELLEGVNIPGRTKKTIVLRESAAHDPLSSTGEWKLIQANDIVLQNFSRKISSYNNGVVLQNPGAQPTKQYLDAITTKFRVNLNVETSDETEPEGGEDDADNIDAPFIGVASRLRTKSVVTFYGIERHDWWVFTPLYRGSGSGQPAGIPQPSPTINF